MIHQCTDSTVARIEEEFPGSEAAHPAGVGKASAAVAEAVTLS
jgi:hypothetical protein